jgi:hypothetical protein
MFPFAILLDLLLFEVLASVMDIRGRHAPEARPGNGVVDQPERRLHTPPHAVEEATSVECSGM